MKALFNKEDNRKELLESYSYILKAVAKANLQYGISYNETVSLFMNVLVNEARDKYPDEFTSAIGVKTGISRKKIPHIPKTNNIQVEESLLLKVLHILSTLSEEKGINSVAVKGDILSFKSIVDDIFKGQESYIAILNEAVSSGCVEVKDGMVTYISKIKTYEKDPVSFMSIVGREFNSIIDTANFNFNEPGKDKTKYQRTWWSSTIPPERINQTEIELREAIVKCAESIDKILVKNEEKNAVGRKAPSGKYKKIGVFFNLFSPRKHDEEFSFENNKQ